METEKKTNKRINSVIKINIGNTVIELGRTYILDHKFDSGAPDGMQAIKATKFPMSDNDNVCSIYFDENTRQYDTGLYLSSKCLSVLDRTIAAERVDQYNTYIRKPFEEFKGVSLSQNESNEFLQNYKYTLYVNREFDTNKITDLFDLFNALMQGDVCNENERDRLYKMNAQFIIGNPIDKKEKVIQSTKKRYDCNRLIGEMISGNREKLNTILSYINRGDSEGISDSTLALTYYKIINDEKTGLDFIDRFNEANEKYMSKVGKEEMEYFAIANKLLSTRQIKKVGSRIMTNNEDVFLGNSLKDVAKFCIDKESEQYKVIMKLHK